MTFQFKQVSNRKQIFTAKKRPPEPDKATKALAKRKANKVPSLLKFVLDFLQA